MKQIRFAFVNNALRSGFKVVDYHFGQLSAASAITNDLKLNHLADVKVGLFDANVLDLTELGNRLLKFKPDFVGFSVYAQRLDYTKNIMEVLRPFIGAAKIVVGGPFVTVEPRRALDFLGADVALRGEVEKTLPAFLRIVAEGGKDADFDDLDGFFLREKHGEIRAFKNSEKIASLSKAELENHFINWQLLKFAEIENEVRYSIFRFMSSRGCTGKCIFCAKIQGNFFRPMSPKKVILEMSRAVSELPKACFLFDDDTFCFDRNRVRDISKAFEYSGLSRKIDRTVIQTTVWSFFDSNGKIDEGLLESLRRFKVKEVSIGVDSLSDADLLRLRKGRYLSRDVFTLMGALKRADFLESAVVFLLMSNTDTSLADFFENISNAYRLVKKYPFCRVLPWNFVMVQFGSPVYYDLKERNLLPDLSVEALIDFKNCAWPTDLAVRTTLEQTWQWNTSSDHCIGGRANEGLNFGEMMLTLYFEFFWINVKKELELLGESKSPRASQLRLIDLRLADFSKEFPELTAGS